MPEKPVTVWPPSGRGVADAPGEGRRITFKAGKLTREAVLMDPPFPEVGDHMLDAVGSEWIVTAVEMTVVLAQVKTNSHR